MTNTTDKYITIPASALSGRELRAHPNGKKVANPDYIEPELPLSEKDQALINAGGTLKGKRIFFPLIM